MSPLGVLSSQEQWKRLFCSANRDPVAVGCSSRSACLHVPPVLFSLISPKASATRWEERRHTSVGLPLPGLLLSDEADQATTGSGKAKDAITSNPLEGLPPAPKVRAESHQWLYCEGF